MAFSIDDASTTEIDDAFSVTPLENGNVRVGIHIAAPALGVAAGSALDAVARERLSTVYFPGGKITMLPAAAIERYTLAPGTRVPGAFALRGAHAGEEVVATETRVERVRIAENLRHDTLEPVFDEPPSRAARSTIRTARSCSGCGEWARAARAGAPRRRTGRRAAAGVHVPGRERSRARSSAADRGTPIDKIVSELMIYVNSAWGRKLAESGTAAIYRVQGGGKVRMSTVPAAHAGLGVDQYAWASSPLRRYVDLVNQRQLIALARGSAPPYAPGTSACSPSCASSNRRTTLTASSSASMERYWCLRWLMQEKVRPCRGDGSAREPVPLRRRCRSSRACASLPALPPGAARAARLVRASISSSSRSTASSG